MEEKKQNVQEEKKSITIPFEEYEQLRTDNARLKDTCNRLFEQGRQMNEALIEKRLSFLFKVVENSVNFSDGFVENCVNEIEESLTIPKEENNK